MYCIGCFKTQQNTGVYRPLTKVMALPPLSHKAPEPSQSPAWHSRSSRLTRTTTWSAQQPSAWSPRSMSGGWCASKGEELLSLPAVLIHLRFAGLFGNASIHYFLHMPGHGSITSHLTRMTEEPPCCCALCPSLWLTTFPDFIPYPFPFSPVHLLHSKHTGLFSGGRVCQAPLPTTGPLHLLASAYSAGLLLSQAWLLLTQPPRRELILSTVVQAVSSPGPATRCSILLLSCFQSPVLFWHHRTEQFAPLSVLPSYTESLRTGPSLTQLAPHLRHWAQNRSTCGR